MSKTLTEIAQQLKESDKKVQLIYAFNGVGKTRLSKEFQKLVDVDKETHDEDRNGKYKRKIIYYNAFTEDLFYWNNDLKNGEKHRLKIQPNTFTDWILEEQELDANIITDFQQYSNNKLTPRFNSEYKKNDDGEEVIVPANSEVTFSFERGDETKSGDIKISKGEESNFIWSIFYNLFKQVIEERESSEDNRSTQDYNKLEYIFIDDPVSSLDENHLINLAISLAQLIKSSEAGVKFIITTHNPLFYNVLLNEFKNSLYKIKIDKDTKKKKEERVYTEKEFNKYLLDKKLDGTFEIKNSTDHTFSYHLFLLSELRNAIETNNIEKYHFNFLRNIFERTATFLGYKQWKYLLENINGQADPLANRILNLSSHSVHGSEELAIIRNEDKEQLKELVDFLTKTYGFYKEDKVNE